MFKYDAFISYRHVRPDMEIAQQVQNLIESYTVSKVVADVDKRSGFVAFRDRDELPAGELGQAIETALESSRYLVVVCSRRTPASQWCRREIAHFLRVRDATHIIAVLVEGEPEESFPPELKDARKVVIREDGTREARRGELLAADVRPGEVASAGFAGYEAIEGDVSAMARLLKESLAILRKTEIHRIMAAICGVSYGEIRQRQRERRLRRIIAASTAVSLALSVFAVTTFGLWRKALAAQRAANEKNASITMSLATNTIAEGDRVRGLLYSRAAMDLADERMADYTRLQDEYQKNLSSALLYGDFTPVVDIQFESGNASFGANADGDEVASIGAGSNLDVWNADNGEKIRSIELPAAPSLVGSSLDGSHYWALGPGGALYVVPCDGGEVETIETGATDEDVGVRVEGQHALVLAGAGETLSLHGFDITTGRKLFDLAPDRPMATVGVRSDGGEFAISFSGGGAARYDAATGEAIGWIVEPEVDSNLSSEEYGRLRYARSGNALAYSSGREIHKVDTATGAVQTVTSDSLATYNYSLSEVFITDDASAAFSLSDRSFSVFRLSLDNTDYSYLSASADTGVVAGSLSPDGTSFAALLEDNSIAQWDTTVDDSSLTMVADHRPMTSQQYANTGPLPSSIASLQYSGDGQRLFACGSDGSLTVIQVRGTEKAETVRGAPWAKSNDGTAVYTQDKFGSYVWDMKGSSVRWAPNTTRQLSAVSNDGKAVTGTSDQGRLAVYGEQSSDVSSDVDPQSDYETQIDPLTSPNGEGPRVVFGRGNDIVFAAADGSVVHADASGTLGRLDAAQQAEVVSLRASPDGSMVAVSREGRGFEVYDVQSREKLAEGEGQAMSLVGAQGEIESVLALDNQRIVRYGSDGQELTTASLPAELASPEDGSVEGSIDGKLLVMRAGAKEIALVDARTGSIVRSFDVDQPDPHALLADGSVVLEDLYTGPSSLGGQTQSRSVGLHSRAYLDELADSLLSGRELTAEERAALGE